MADQEGPVGPLNTLEVPGLDDESVASVVNGARTY